MRVLPSDLFLPKPPEEKLPIPIFRSVEARRRERPSPDLLDTIETRQHCQDYLRENRVECRTESLEILGSEQPADDPAAIGKEMYLVVKLADEWNA